MNVSISFGRNLGLTHSATTERTRRGLSITHWLTVWRLHVILSRRA